MVNAFVEYCFFEDMDLKRKFVAQTRNYLHTLGVYRLDIDIICFYRFFVDMFLSLHPRVRRSRSRLFLPWVRSFGYRCSEFKRFVDCALSHDDLLEVL